MPDVSLEHLEREVECLQRQLEAESALKAGWRSSAIASGADVGRLRDQLTAVTRERDWYRREYDRLLTEAVAAERGLGETNQ